MEFWHWFILAALFAAIEILAPGIFFIWLGIAAIITGGIVFFASDLGWEIQGIIFAGLAVLSVIIGGKLQRRLQRNFPETNLNRRADQLIGRIVILNEPIQNGRGSAKIGDSVWRVEGEDLPKGAKVKVTGAEGSVLKVDPIR